MRVRTTTAFVGGAIVALVLGTGTTYAANGGHLVLGRDNFEGSAASLNNSNGTALILRSKSGQPSLKVNRTTKIPNLNADTIDGVNSTQIARDVRVGTATAAGFILQGPDDTTTDDDFVVAVAQCPANAQVMGGGADDQTDDGVLLASLPDTAGTWLAVSSASPTQDNADNFTAFARCWNPLADVADATAARQGARTLSPSARRLVAGMSRTR